MARTTLDIDASILRELRRRGERERKSMGQVASELLAAALAESGQPTAARTFSWTSADLGAPRVDLHDKEALSHVLDRPA
jgi:hypothetical protein